jgi:hypothetical protein
MILSNDTRSTEQIKNDYNAQLAFDKKRDADRSSASHYWMGCLCMGSDKLIELAKTCPIAEKAARKLKYIS